MNGICSLRMAVHTIRPWLGKKDLVADVPQRHLAALDTADLARLYPIELHPPQAPCSQTTSGASTAAFETLVRAATQRSATGGAFFLAAADPPFAADAPLPSAAAGAPPFFSLRALMLLLHHTAFVWQQQVSALNVAVVHFSHRSAHLRQSILRPQQLT